MDEPVIEARQAGKASPERLDSWKAIAAYLRRDVTTVRVHPHFDSIRGDARFANPVRRVCNEQD